ncbi:MAG: hypothetical protein JSW68_02115 [Burkholderiales bacterium]|nr:MAG: hypothetical protein JSW68_02115 [Burkholderiales bacterium]
MHIELYDVLVFLHVLLFGYWLGADLGVFFCDSQLTREDLSLEERLRVREIRRKVDMAPRTCAPLILPIGFTIAVTRGSEVTGPWLWLVWLLSLAWLAMLWLERMSIGTARERAMNRANRLIWFAVAFAMLALGAYALATGSPVQEGWLALKILLYGVMVLCATWILRAADHWAEIFAMVRAGGEQRIEGERRMKRNRINAGSAAGTLWLVVILIGFIGTTKPF